jgi:transglutaminase-like putative cysteine protease
MPEKGRFMFRRRHDETPGADRGLGQTPHSSPATLIARGGGWRGWLNFLLLFVALETVVLCLERTHWITPQPSLTLVLILAMLWVRFLTLTLLSTASIHLLAIAIGAPITFWQVYSLMPYDTFYFAVLLASLTWLMGYLSSWFLLRKKNAWVAVCLGTLVILVNLSNLPGGYYWYFGLFFAAAALLIFQTRQVKGRTFSEQSTRHTGRALLYFVTTLLAVVILAVSLAWMMPAVRIPQLQTMIATQILWKSDIEQSRFNIFANVPSKQTLSTNSMRLTLPFVTSWHEGDRIDYIVASPTPSYWEVRAYDVYTADGWENSPVTDSNLGAGTAWTGNLPPPNNEQITYIVTPNIMTDVLLDAGSFIATSKPVQVQVSSGDVIGLLANHVLSAGESYSVTVAVSQATPLELDAASENYPPSILENYLQLYSGFPESVRELSANITANATTPYDKVLLIKDYLSGIPYKTDIEARPEGTDGVAYFLFTQKAGFCVHFASAMAVMLRSVGVPTRLAIGYLPGDPGSEKGEYILRDKYYHAWVQVYFPGYGWVDIEATPSSATDAASQVTLSGPVVSSESIAALPQWGVWVPGFYGLVPPGDSGAAAAAPSSGSIPGPWAFAGQLGKFVLIVVIIILTMAVLLVLWLFIRASSTKWIWRVDRSDLASETYRKMCQISAMMKIGPRPQQTPLEYATVLAAEFPERTTEIREITQAYLEREFGGREGKLDLFNEARLLQARRSLFSKLISRLTQVEKMFRGRV